MGPPAAGDHAASLPAHKGLHGPRIQIEDPYARSIRHLAKEDLLAVRRPSRTPTIRQFFRAGAFSSSAGAADGSLGSEAASSLLPVLLLVSSLGSRAPAEHPHTTSLPSSSVVEREIVAVAREVRYGFFPARQSPSKPSVRALCRSNAGTWWRNIRLRAQTRQTRTSSTAPRQPHPKGLEPIQNGSLLGLSGSRELAVDFNSPSI